MADAPAPPTGADDPLTKLLLPLQQGSAGPSPDSPAPAGSSPGTPAPPAAPTGPPKLRGEAMSPAPQQPGAPPEDLSLPAVWEGAKKNFTRSAMNNIASTVEGLNPFNLGRDWEGIKNIGLGVASKVGLIDQGDPKAQAQHQAGVNAIENMNWEHYGTLDNFLRTMRDDPATPIADAAAAASILAGGEGIAARVPGVMGDVLRAGTGAAKIAQYADPTAAALTLARKGVGAVGKIPGAGIVGKGVGALGGAGVGAALQHVIPVPGAGIIGGGIIGEKIAEGAMKTLSKPGVRRAVGAGVDTVARVAPKVGAFARTQPMSPEEQAAAGAVGQAYGGPGASGAAPGAAAGAPPAPMDPEEQHARMMAEGFGLIPWDAASTAPSSGLQGGGGEPPSHVHAVVRQAEGGANQPVGYQPGGGSTARGAYQMTDGTYANNLRKYHPEIVAKIGNSPAAIRAYRNTPAGWALNEPMGQQMVTDEMGHLQAQGIAPTADNVGTLHMLGNTRLLQADPNTPIEQVTGADQRRANAGIFRNIHVVGDFLNWMHHRNSRAAAQLQPEQPAYAADGGRVERADGGKVIDLTEKLLARANTAQKAAQSATKPLLGLSDDHVAQALRVAQRGL